MTPRVRIDPCAGVVARNAQGHLLLVQRRDDRTWGLPGGHLEAGETWEGCARREFTEETGMSVRIAGLFGVYSDPDTQRHRTPDGLDVHFVGVVFEGEADGEARRAADGEIAAVRWFPPSGLPAALFGPDRPVIEDAISGAARPVIR